MNMLRFPNGKSGTHSARKTRSRLQVTSSSCCGCSKYKSATESLDSYIHTWEESNGEIIVRHGKINPDPDIIRILRKLWKLVLRQQNDKDKALESLNKSNKAMEDLLQKLQASSHTQLVSCGSGDTTRQFDSMSTESLLAIDAYIFCSPRLKLKRKSQMQST